MEQVGKLTTQEALAARDMWSEIFYEDSEQFTGYYFAEKMKDNREAGQTVVCHALSDAVYRADSVT